LGHCGNRSRIFAGTARYDEEPPSLTYLFLIAIPSRNAVAGGKVRNWRYLAALRRAKANWPRNLAERAKPRGTPKRDVVLSEIHEQPSDPAESPVGEAREAETAKETPGESRAKPGFFRRLFGRKTDEAKPDEAKSDETETKESKSEEPTQDKAARDEALSEPDAAAEAQPEVLQEAAAQELAAVVEPPAAPPIAETPVAAVEAIEDPSSFPEIPAKTSWWSRLRDGLSRSSSALGTGIADIFTKRKLDATMLEDLEDVLIRADLGVAAASRISEAVGKGRYDKAIAVDEVKNILAAEVERVLAPYGKPLAIDPAHKPFVILVIGVNGSGKTTTIGKLAARFTREGHKVMLAAGDTFRAAAIEQLRIWGGRLGCEVIARDQGGDAAGLGFDAIKAAQDSGADILLMDTAGRLQNRTELMAELEKIIRVMKKLDASAPHAVLLVLDATVGQNAMSQVEIFGRMAGVTGLVMTKLDGTARGGILVAIAEKFQLPIHFIGVGETADDLAPFEAKDFARAIAGIGV
jgi:fused signal recognition particle receptor